MNAVRVDVCRSNATRWDALSEKRLRVLIGLVLAGALALPAARALAQDSGGNPIMPKFSIGGGEQKRKLTPEEEERQRRLDADYKAATSKIPTQKTLDPWADVRQAPAGSGQKASAPAHNASAQKKKQSAQ